jgi:hypothetical protein
LPGASAQAHGERHGNRFLVQIVARKNELLRLIEYRQMFD